MNNTTKPASPAWLELLNRSSATIAVETSIPLLVGMAAIGGNLLVVISIYRNPSLRTITNYFVLSLSVTDILYPAMILPPSIVWSVKRRFTIEQSICDFQAISTYSLTCVSIFMIVLMAVNRFVCVCKPQKYKKVFNKITSLSMISFVWITSFVLTSLSMADEKFAFASFVPQEIRCGLLYHKGNTLAMAVGNTINVFVLVIPVSVIFYCYFQVFKKIRQHKRNVAPASNQGGLGTSVQDIKVTWTMFAVLMGFCFTWIPTFIIIISKNICSWSNCTVPRQARLMASFTALSSSAVNPVIYGAMNTAFRREYTKILRCRYE